MIHTCVLLLSAVTIMASRKRFTKEDVLKQLDMSDDDNFTDNDSDRDSDFELGDIERDSDGTEDYDAPVVDAGNDSSELESGVATTVPTPSIQACAPRVWDAVSSSYMPNISFPYSHTAGLNSSITVKKRVTCAEHVLLSLHYVLCLASRTTMLVPIISHDTVEQTPVG